MTAQVEHDVRFSLMFAWNVMQQKRSMQEASRRRSRRCPALSWLYWRGRYSVVARHLRRQSGDPRQVPSLQLQRCRDSLCHSTHTIGPSGISTTYKTPKIAAHRVLPDPIFHPKVSKFSIKGLTGLQGQENGVKRLQEATADSHSWRVFGIHFK